MNKEKIVIKNISIVGGMRDTDEIQGKQIVDINIAGITFLNGEMIKSYRCITYNDGYCVKTFNTMNGDKKRETSWK
jgi:hypothetical protein